MHQGSRIKYLIEQKGITIVEFAKQIDQSEQNMHRLFKCEFIHTKTLSKMAGVLGCTLIDLLQPGISNQIREPKTEYKQNKLTPTEMISHLQEQLKLALQVIERDKKLIAMYESQIALLNGKEKTFRKAHSK